jgi:alpha-D-ribose 1-methylphosphonate 5-triphosphate synthase subunit PhnH
MTPLPPGPGVPEPLRAVLKSFHDALLALGEPGAPRPVFAAAQAKLPPAAAYPNCLALVSDLNILAHSDGVHWIRQDTGAVIV